MGNRFTSKLPPATQPFSIMVTYAFRYSRNFGYIVSGILLLYAIGEARNFGYFLAITGFIVLIALAGFAVGGIIGFLFGIPHTVEKSQFTQASTTGVPATGATGTTASTGTTSTRLVSSSVQNAPPKANFTPSTNLEQIADWLTKILVGVGLTQIPKIIRYYNQLCQALGEPLNTFTNGKYGAALAGAVMIVSAIEGFLIVYLWTYLYLIRIQNSMEDIMSTIDNKLLDNDLNDKGAIDVANTQLNLPHGAPDISEDDIHDTFATASKKVLSSIFFMAVNVRREFWDKDKERMERIIPILRALIRLDGDLEYPENHSELGFALKDQRQPDYKAAIKKFNKAIEGFGEGDNYGYKAITYFNRAFCNIKLDPNFSQVPPKPSTEEMKTTINSDLIEAAKEQYVAQIIETCTETNEWKKVNA
jgi:tetratricopeptide (TPR) repeat protein